MVDPITATAGVSMAMTAAGGIMSGLGANEAGQANADAYRYKAGVALLNKQVADQNASWATQVGAIKGEEAGLEAGQNIANTKVAQAVGNIDTQTGSAATVRATQTQTAQFDQNVISWDAAKTAYGYEVKGASDTAEAALDTSAAEQSETAGTINMATSFLNAGGSVASKWLQGKQAGMTLMGA